MCSVALIHRGLTANGLATAAIMLAAFQQYGMQPGPLLFERSGDLVWTLLASLFIGLVVLVILNMQFAVLWAKMLYIPRHYLYAGITVLSMLGVYAISSATLDLWVVLAVGLLGFIMRRYGFPLAPVLIAVVLGPLAETELRRALTVSEGDPSILVSNPSRSSCTRCWCWPWRCPRCSTCGTGESGWVGVPTKPTVRVALVVRTVDTMVRRAAPLHPPVPTPAGRPPRFGHRDGSGLTRSDRGHGTGDSSP